MRKELRVNTVRIPEDRRFYNGTPIRPRSEARKVKLARFLWYFLVALLGGVVVWGGYTGHWGVAVGSLIFGNIIVYVVYSIVAWLFGLPKVDPPEVGGGGAPEEDNDFMSDPASFCIPGSVFYSETSCNSSSLDD